MNFLEQAIKAHQANNLTLAEDLYTKHLSLYPLDANAKQLLGLVCCFNGKLDSAQRLMEDSLKINPNQPHVLSNLGNCLEQLGKIEEAAQHYQEAIELDPNYIDAYKNLALSYKSSGKDRLALEIIEKALKSKPQELSLLKLQGTLANNLKDYSTAISTFEKVLRLQPNAIVARHNLGVALRLAGRPVEALEQYLILERNNISNYQLKHNIANAYSDMGQLDKAKGHYEQAIELNLGYVDSHKNLNDLLWELKDQDRYLASYKKALPVETENQALHFAYASSLLRASRYQEAYSFLNRLKTEFKQVPEYFDLIARCLVRLGNKKEALEQQKYAVAYEEASIEHLVNYARNLIETGEADTAIEQLERALKIDPQHQMAIAYLAVCWRINRDSKESVINNYNVQVREYSLDKMGDFEDIESYCAALKEYLGSLHSAKQQPLDQTLYRGTQTKGNLFDNENPLLQILIQKINACIEDYIKQTKTVSKINLAWGAEDEFYFSGSWSVKLGEQGFHVSHVHPMGRLSSCFYVDLPNAVEESNDHQGWIKFGEPNLDLEPKLSAVRYVKPKVGKLVLFPSYMWHGTVPFDTEESRLTIAFDVMPLAKISINP